MGNMVSGAGVTMVYDEANRIGSATPVSGGTEYYGYAPDNKRVYRRKTNGVRILAKSITHSPLKPITILP